MGVYGFGGNELTPQSLVPIITGELPTVFIESSVDYTELTKETASNGSLTFVDKKKKFSCPVKIKLQGSGALSYSKKNLNITFYDDEGKKQKVIFNDWYPTNKVHIKANEFDYSMVRNSVGAIFTYKMMGKYLPEGARGYVESFPVIVYYNNVYFGCHTFNLPQDSNTYNFSGKKEKAGKHLAYRCKKIVDWMPSASWEYRGDEDESNSMRAVFDAVLNVMVNYNSLTKQTIETYFDKQTIIAYWTLADIMLAVDSLVNNWTLVTWDGEKWYHVWYDLDIIFGLGGWSDAGSTGYALPATFDITTCEQYQANGFWQKIVSLYESDITNMYANLRNNGADAENIYELFHNYQKLWGWQNIQADRIKWGSDKPSSSDINKTWIENRLAFLDTKYGYSVS